MQPIEETVCHGCGPFLVIVTVQGGNDASMYAGQLPAPFAATAADPATAGQLQGANDFFAATTADPAMAGHGSGSRSVRCALRAAVRCTAPRGKSTCCALRVAIRRTASSNNPIRCGVRCCSSARSPHAASSAHAAGLASGSGPAAAAGPVPAELAITVGSARPPPADAAAALKLDV